MNLDWDNIEATPLALEIHANFERKMAPGGEIDRILNGNQPVPKRPPLGDEEIDAIKRNIDAQLKEYAEAINGASSWMAAWKARLPKGFRGPRRKRTSKAAE